MASNTTQIGLWHMVRDKIISELNAINKGSQWKILVLDHFTTRLTNACCKMHELMSSGVTLTEDLYKSREPLRTMECIYFIAPTEDSLKYVMADFVKYDGKENKLPKYKAAHILMTSACPKNLFNKLCKSPTAQYIKTLKEINCYFIPVESQVFSLESPKTLSYFHGFGTDELQHFEDLAEKLATLCVVLQEYPQIRYRAGSDKNKDFAQMVSKKLEQYSEDNPTMGEGTQKDRSILLILDRSFDPLSPLLHERTYQAMVTDLLNIEDGIYKYTGSDGKAQIEILDEWNEYWVELRHLPIIDANSKIKNAVAVLTKSVESDAGKVTALKQKIQKMGKTTKQKNACTVHLDIATKCQEINNRYGNDLSSIEQLLAFGKDIDGNMLGNGEDLLKISPYLQDKRLSAYDRIRLILLYIDKSGGKSEENLQLLKRQGNIDDLESKEKSNFSILCNFNEKIINSSRLQRHYLPSNRKRRPNVSEEDPLSRWVPYVKDIMEAAVEDKIENRDYPVLGERGGSKKAVASSARGNWNKSRDQARVHSGPRLILFVLGGITKSEMRSAYEVSRSAKNWEVIIGGSHILTPKIFLEDVKNLKEVVQPGISEKVSYSQVKIHE